MKYFLKLSAGLFLVLGVILLGCNKEEPFNDSDFPVLVQVQDSTASSFDIYVLDLVSSDPAVDASGVCWGTSPNPIVGSNNFLNLDGSGTYKISGLSSSTQYYLVAYYKKNGLYVYDKKPQKVVRTKVGVVLNGLVAYYPLNGNAKDLSGRGNDLTGTVSYTTNRKGASNSAAQFNSSTGFLYRTNPNGFPSGNQPYSISFWTKIDNWNPDMLITGYGSSGAARASNYFKTSINNSMVHYHWNIDATIPDPAFIRGQWVHVVVTYSGNGINYYYINGNYEWIWKHGTTLNINPTVVSIGGRFDPNNSRTFEKFTGVVDEVRIYNRELTSAEVKLLYAN